MIKNNFLLLFIFIFYACPHSFSREKRITDSLETALSGSSQDTSKVNILNELSWQYSDNDFTRAIEYGQLALKKARNAGFKKGEGTALNRIAVAYDYNGDYDKALEYYREALMINQRSEDKKAEADSYSNIGVVYYAKGNYNEAVDYYLQALKIREDIDDKKGISQSLNNIGIIYRILGEYDKAMEYYLRSAELKKELKDSLGLMKSLSNVGIIYLSQGNNEKALEFFEKSLDMSYRLENIKGISEDLINIAITHKNLGHHQKAVEDYHKALEISEKLGDRKQVTQILNNLSALYIVLGQYDRSAGLSLKALQAAQELESMELVKLCHQSLAESYLGKGDYKKAFEHLAAFSQVKDSLLNEEINKHILELEATYENAKNESKIAVLDAENRKKKQEQLYLVAFSLVLGFSVLLLLNQNRVRKKLNAELAQKNKLIEDALSEKEILLKEIHHRVKNNLQIISSLLSLQSRSLHGSEAQKAVLEGKNRVNSMALIHQKLYQGNNLLGISVKEYFNSLAITLFQSYGIREDRMDFNLDVDQVLLDVDTLIPLGLIVNELISNSLKYAYNPEGENDLMVSLRKQDEKLFLRVRDNGNGFPAEFEPGRSKSFGLSLVHSLSRKLKAEVTINSGPGAEVCLNIHKFKVVEN